MKSIVIILFHCGYWLSYLLLITFFYVLPLGSEPFPSTVSDGLYITLAGTIMPAFSGFYVFYLRLVPQFLARREVSRFLNNGVLASLIIGLLVSVLSTWALNYLSITYPLSQYKVMQETVAWRQVWLFLGFSFMAGLNGLVGTLLRGFVTWYTDIRVRESLEKETLKTQLELLKAQLQPHFLFNTLNNIDMLIQEDTKLASSYLNYLSEMLRYMLYKSSQDLVPVEQELEFVKQYLELQKIRTTNGHFAEFSVKGTTSGLLIAPLLFLPFLENAFKYAANKKISKAISLKINITNQGLVFSCRNLVSCPEPPSENKGGLGLRLVRKRLELLYKDRYDLTIESTETHYDVYLRIELNT